MPQTLRTTGNYAVWPFKSVKPCPDVAVLPGKHYCFGLSVVRCAVLAKARLMLLSFFLTLNGSLKVPNSHSIQSSTFPSYLIIGFNPINVYGSLQQFLLQDFESSMLFPVFSLLFFFVSCFS